jgi:hypothetical protein
MNLQVISRSFHRTDDLLKGFTYGFFLVELQKRKFRLDEARVREIFGEYLRRQVIDARQAFDDHIDEIMDCVNQSRAAGKPKL